MWAQSWNNLIDVMAPYPDQNIPSITDALLQQNYTAVKVYRSLWRTKLLKIFVANPSAVLSA